MFHGTNQPTGAVSVNRADSVIGKERKTHPSLQPPEKFYPRMLGYLLHHVVDAFDPKSITKVIVITDRIPITRKRRAVEKAVKATLTQMLTSSVPYQILHHESRSSPSLRVVDYVCWAISRKWERCDPAWYEVIRPAIKSEFDIFQRGVRMYY